MYGASCEFCPLKDKADVFEGKGPEDARFMVVTDVPNHRPEAYGRLMQQSAMGFFGKSMMAEQFGKEDFYFYPCVRCPYDADSLTTKDKTLIQKCCRPYLIKEIRRVKPEVVIPLGALPSRQVFGRAVKITKVRGVPERTEELGHNVLVLPMLNPIMPVIYPQHEPTFRADAATLGRLVDSGYDITQASSDVLGDYEYIDDLQFLVDQKPTLISYDTENTGLRWFAPDAKILTMQFSIEEGKSYVLPWDHPDHPQSNRAKKRLKRQFRELMCRPEVTVIGQNAKYDAVYTYGQLGIRYRIGGDTLMLAALLDENAITKNLDDLVKRYVPDMAGYADMFNKTVDKSRMIELPLDDKFLHYAGGDSDATLRLYNALFPVLEEDPKLLNHYLRVSLPGLNVFASVELRGLLIDDSQIDEFEAFMAQKVEEMNRELLAQVPKSIKRKHINIKPTKDNPSGNGLKFSRKDFLLDILFYHEDGFCLKPKVYTKTTAKLDPKFRVPSTSTKDHLPYFYDECPFTYELSEYIKQERILSTNVRGFRKKYIVDDLVRAVYSLAVTVTGRTSSEDPNGQNFPKRGPIAKAYRKMFIAPPGHVILEADLSQAELRIAADMANDPTMIKIYRQAGDIHTATAKIALHISEAAWEAMSKDEKKDARTKAKAINFGFLYGMGWRKFIAYAKTQYGVVFTEKEAQRIRATFFSTYYQLPEWHKAMRDFAHAHGFVRSYSGRVRHLPMINSSDDGVRSEAERQAINSPVQEFGSSLGVMACGRMDSELDPEYLSIVGFVHDAIYAYVPIQYAEWGAKTLKHYMQTNPLEEWFGRRMRLPIVADVSIGINLGEMAEMGEINTGDTFAVNDYDFNALWKEDDKTRIILPRQRIPPNNGRLTYDPYLECA